MTPKEKAKELVDKFKSLSKKECDCLEYMCICFKMYDTKAKQCALICVDEIIEVTPELEPMETYFEEGGTTVDYFINEDYTFWKEVKQEINLL